MPRRGTKRGMRNRGGLAKRVKVNTGSTDNTETCSAVEMVVSTLNDNSETCPDAEVVSTANVNMVTWPDEEIFTTVNDNSETCPVVEIVSTANNVVRWPVEEIVSTVNVFSETCPVVEMVSTVNNNMVTCPVVSMVNDNTSTWPVEEIVSTLNEESNNVIDLTQDNELEAVPVSSDVPLNSVSNNPVANLNLDLKINPVSSTSIPETSCSTSVNDVASSALVGKSKPKISKSGSETPAENECPVCLHPCVHPSKLPCSHVFCYLCIKGIARIGQPCPMCRSPIPHYYANRPQLVSPNKPSPNDSEEEEDQEKYCWFYQGRNGGWWQFEERMSDEIEENHSLGVSSFEMMICGSLYVIDTVGCVQYPKNCPMRRRRLLRDLPSHINRIGVAGIHSVPARTK